MFFLFIVWDTLLYFIVGPVFSLTHILVLFPTLVIAFIPKIYSKELFYKDEIKNSQYILIDAIWLETEYIEIEEQTVYAFSIFVPYYIGNIEYTKVFPLDEKKKSPYVKVSQNNTKVDSRITITTVERKPKLKFLFFNNGTSEKTYSTLYLSKRYKL
jgi:hypothetical protein